MNLMCGITHMSGDRNEVTGGSITLRYNDEWSGLADFLANMMEKYAGQMDLDELPNPDRYYRNKKVREMYSKYMRLSERARKTA